MFIIELSSEIKNLALVYWEKKTGLWSGTHSSGEMELFVIFYQLQSELWDEIFIARNVLMSWNLQYNMVVGHKKVS